MFLTRRRFEFLLIGVLMGVPSVFFTQPQQDWYTDGSNLPLVFISTEDSIVDDPRVGARMSIVNNDSGLNHQTDHPTDYDGLVTIEIRGASSQAFPKKGYAFETVDEYGQNNNVALLGMPPENDWILHGPYTDKSLIRNALVYELGDRIHRYVSRRRFCELFVNDDYQGVYLLAEKIKRDVNRVDLAKLLPSDTVGDELTGGYILKIDKFNGGASGSWSSPYPTEGGQTSFIQFHHPKQSDLHPAQSDYIEQHVTAFEHALASDEFEDPAMGYAAFIDVQSFLDLHLINELSKNVDGFHFSTFFFKEKDSDGGKLVMGPWWDYNIALGNANYCEGEQTEGFQLSDNGCFELVPFWFRRLLQHKVYQSRLERTWAEYRSGPWSDASVCGVIDSLSEMLSSASERDHARWRRLGDYVWPNAFVGDSYQEELAYLKDWTMARMHWMDCELGLRDRPQDAPNMVQLRPNPTSHFFTLAEEHQGSTLSLHNFYGWEIEKFEVLYDFQSFSVEHLASGVYIVQLWDDQHQLVGRSKLIKP